MSDAPAIAALIPRFLWSIDECDDDCDQICEDRLTGRVIVRYDLGDPANYAASHGGWSKDEYLKRKGLDPRAEIPLADSKLTVPAGEAERHAAAKQRRAEREKEEAEARELLGFLGEDAAAFNFEEWHEGERAILAPALEKRGFTAVSFHMLEEDSFGPLIRGCRARDPEGKRVRFYYG